MTEPEKAKPPKPRRRWRKRLGWSLLGLLVLAVVFHRPLLVMALRTAAIRWAARQNVQLSAEIDGSVLAGITLKNVRAIPTGPSPVDSIQIESVRVHYDLSRLFRNGIRDVVTGYRLRNAHLTITPEHGTKTQKDELTKALRDILQQPALFSDHVQIENFNLTVKTEDGALVLGGVHALLDPQNPGYLRFEELTIPRIGSWRQVRAPASYLDRHLIIRNLKLGGELHAKRLELDSSRRAKGIAYLSFEGTVLGGDVGLFLWRREIDRKTSDAQLTLYLGKLPLKTVHDFLRWKPDVSGLVTKAWVQIAGNPENPSQWEGMVSLQGEHAAVAGFRIDRAMGDLIIGKGAVRLRNGEIETAGNRLSIRVDQPLPGTTDALLASGLEAVLGLEFPDISKVHPVFKAGAIHGSGLFRIRDPELSLTLNGTTSGVAGIAGPESERSRGDAARTETDGADAFYVETGTIKAGLSKEIRHRAASTPWFDGFHAEVSAVSSGMRLGFCAIDSGTTSARIEAGRLLLDSATFQRGPNSVRCEGNYVLPDGDPDWAHTKFEARFKIDAPALASLNSDPNAPVVKGALAGSGEIHRAAGETSGRGRLEGTDLAFRQFAAKRLTVDMPVEHNGVRAARFQLDLNGRDTLAGETSVVLHPPFAYEGRISGSVRDLSVFQPLISMPLAGALAVDWRGSGELTLLHHSGQGRIAMSNGRFGELTGLSGEIAGHYSPEAIDLTECRMQSDQFSVKAGVRLSDQRLQIDGLRLEAGKTAVLSGSLRVPMDLRTPARPETIFPADGALEGTLAVDTLDLGKLIAAERSSVQSNADAGPTVRESEIGNEHVGKAWNERVVKKPETRRAIALTGSASPSETGITGQLSGSIALGGNIGAPQVAVGLKGRNLQVAAAKTLQPCSAAASLIFRDDRIALNGVISQPGLSSFQITGAMPLPLKKTIAERRIDMDTPVTAAIKLSPSPAAFLTALVPQIRYAEGRIGLDATVAGALGHPQLNGALSLDLPAIHFQGTNVPGIDRLRGDLRFTENALTIQRLEGDVAGGPFSVSGRIGLEQWSEPALDLRIRSQGTLLVRNDSLTLRADSDLKITGPLSKANVSGGVGITKSRFFRDIEILPIGLPGSPAPKPAGERLNPSIDAAPFRDWNLDVTIKTAEPFLIRGNLANGQAHADLHLGGNGLAPTLEGSARIENFVASLPFSRLTVDYGYLHFSPDNPFDPTLDIRGTSRIRDYNISVYIYGTAVEPQTLFSSEPSMPQEEIIALLATGATTKEFTENNQVLAGRAGVLLVQDLYHKVFKRRSPQSEAKLDQPLDRFSLDVGTVDPRTGRQEINGRFKLSNEYEIGAGVDVQGEVQVQMRYLLRFR